MDAHVVGRRDAAENLFPEARRNRYEKGQKNVLRRQRGIFDFREIDSVKKVLTTDHEQTKVCLGIDQNFCLNDTVTSKKYALAAGIVDPITNRIMEVLTDFPGLHVYAGNHLGGNDQKGTTPYAQYGGICFEAQMYPNAINMPEFESPVIKAGEVKYHACGYRFNA